MAYIKFIDSNNIIECSVAPERNIVTLKFFENVIIDKSGFLAFLDPKAEIDIGGNTYLKYTTIYRNDKETAKYNGYQLSNDGSIYKEPNLEIPYEPTTEELEKQEKQNKINDLESQISEFKSKLSETDYIFTKNYELMLVGKSTNEYDYKQLHKDRQNLRDFINQYENKLKLLEEK